MPRTRMVDTELRVWRPVRSYTSHLPREQKKRLNLEDLCLKGGEVHVKAGGLTYQTSLCNRPVSKSHLLANTLYRRRWQFCNQFWPCICTLKIHQKKEQVAKGDLNITLEELVG